MFLQRIVRFNKSTNIQLLNFSTKFAFTFEGSIGKKEHVEAAISDFAISFAIIFEGSIGGSMLRLLICVAAPETARLHAGNMTMAIIH